MLDLVRAATVVVAMLSALKQRFALGVVCALASGHVLIASAVVVVAAAERSQVAAGDSVGGPGPPGGAAAARWVGVPR